MIDGVCKTCGKCCLGEISGNLPCKWLSSTGCTLEEKSNRCEEYPFIFIHDKNQPNAYRVLIDTACPNAEVFLRRKNELTGNEPISICVEVDEENREKQTLWTKYLTELHENTYGCES